jgi:short-subunit dehydrogenase
MIGQQRIAWITGGGTGIGKALAEAMYREGYWVVISGRRKDVLVNAAQDIQSRAVSGQPGDIWALPGDVSDPAYVAEVQRAVRERWGDIDILVNNAGENPHHTFQEASVEEFEQNFRVNCLAAIRCVKAVLPAMQTRGRGEIVNVSSIIGRWASASSSAYTASKFALAGFTDALRQELLDTGVHVMGVYPGLIQTPMTEPFTQSSFRRWAAKPPEAMAAAILRGIRRKQRDVCYPWYVSWMLRIQRTCPDLMDKLRKSYGRS